MIINTPTDNEIPVLRTLWKEAFGDSDPFLDTFFRTAYSPERCRIARTDTQIVSALYWFRCSYNDMPVAYLYAVATAKAYRGQGICRKLIENTHAHLLSLGYRGTVLVPGSKSLFRFYETMGYQPCGTVHSFTCTAAGEPVPLTSINKDTFATLRRRYLPENSVIQEQENLDFLVTQVSFYAGDNVLLTARKEGNTLHGLELLGDTSLTPKLLATLGCTEGTFRTPGKDTPFAMSYSFYPDKSIVPSYFGFAFD